MQKTFSHSSLSSFEDCPRKYWFRYVAKVRVDTEGIEAFVGKRVHEILERLYVFVGEDMVPSLPKVVWRYHQNFDAAYDAKRIRIVRSGTDADFYRAQGERCLENYYRQHYPFDGDETVGLERPVKLALDEAGRYRIRGIADRIVRARDGALEIHDFKTGRRVPTQEQLDRDRQLALYEMALREELNEQGEVRLVWHFVLSGRRCVSTRTPEELDALRDEVIAVIDRIRAESEWAEKTSGLCDWCEYRSMCPAFGGELPVVPSAKERADDAQLELAPSPPPSA